MRQKGNSSGPFQHLPKEEATLLNIRQQGATLVKIVQIAKCQRTKLMDIPFLVQKSFLGLAWGFQIKCLKFMCSNIESTTWRTQHSQSHLPI
jgi:hypothetical protein